MTDAAATEAKSADSLTYVVDGKTYVIEVMDLDGIEWRDMKRETGLDEANLLRGAILTPGDIEAVAAFLWVWRRRTETKLTYEDSLKSVNLRTLIPEDDKKEPTDPPE